MKPNCMQHKNFRLLLEHPVMRRGAQPEITTEVKSTSIRSTSTLRGSPHFLEHKYQDLRQVFVSSILLSTK